MKRELTVINRLVQYIGRLVKNTRCEAQREERDEQEERGGNCSSFYTTKTMDACPVPSQSTTDAVVYYVPCTLPQLQFKPAPHPNNYLHIHCSVSIISLQSLITPEYSITEKNIHAEKRTSSSKVSLVLCPTTLGDGRWRVDHGLDWTIGQGSWKCQVVG
jgi:hypothetical protein